VDVPRVRFTYANGINNSGQIVGSYDDPFIAHSHGFLLDNGVFTYFDAPDAILTEAYGINNSGQIVGYFRPPSREFHGFLKDNEVYTTFGLPGLQNSFNFVGGINDSGVVVGYFQRAAEGSDYSGFYVGTQ